MKKFIFLPFLFITVLLYAQEAEQLDSVYINTANKYYLEYHTDKDCKALPSDTSKVKCVHKSEVADYHACVLCTMAAKQSSGAKSASTSSSSTTSSYPKAPSSTTRTIYTGPRGGQYYYNSKGNKVYIKKK